MGLAGLDKHDGPRQRDLPEPIKERPHYKKIRARRLLRQAAKLAHSLPFASTQGEELKKREQIARLSSEAAALKKERMDMLTDFDRAARVPPNKYMEKAWGAAPGEPLAEFPRALRRMLLECDVKLEMADRMVLVKPQNIDNDKARASGEGNGKRKR